MKLCSVRARRPFATLACVATLSMASEARAYRPFNGTDAAVSPVGTFELELGPVQFYRRGTSNYLIAPATVLNLGVASNLELVVDFDQVLASRPQADEARLSWNGTDALLKWVLRPGSLQGAEGISIALESGLLLPELHAESGFGAQANLILSQRGRLGTIHLNEEAALSRSGSVDLLSSVIVEAPETFVVRPVAEIFAEGELDTGAATYSALLGAIWSAAETINVDGAFRMAREDGARALEVRLGFTWARTLWSPSRSIAPRAYVR